MLYRLVNRQDEAVAVLRLNILFIFHRHVGVIRIFSRDHAPVLALQIFLILRFQAGEALVVAAHKPNDMRSKIVVWIIPFRVVQNGYVLAQLVIAHKFANLIRHVLFHPTRDHVVSGIFCKRIFHSLLLNPQNGRKTIQNNLPYFFILNNRGRKHNFVRRRADGERLVIAVVNRAALG